MALQHQLPHTELNGASMLHKSPAQDLRFCCANSQHRLQQTVPDCSSQSHSGRRPTATGGLGCGKHWEFSELADLWLKPSPQTYLYCLVHRKLPAPPGLLCPPLHPHLGSPFSLSANAVFLVHNYSAQNKARTSERWAHLVDSCFPKQPLFLSNPALQEHSSAQIRSNLHWMSALTRTQGWFKGAQPCVLQPQTSVVIPWFPAYTSEEQMWTCL